MRLSKCLISTLSSVESSLNVVVFNIPFNAATTSDPFIITGIPTR